MSRGAGKRQRTDDRMEIYVRIRAGAEDESAVKVGSHWHSTHTAKEISA
jgi:hypothetical protein